MRVLIFGANGMLGHKLYQNLEKKFDVLATIRSNFASVGKFGIFDENSIICGVDADDPASVRHALAFAKPDCVINAIGLIKQVPSAKDVIKNLTINSIFPHRLAAFSAEFGFRLITISTDCVFDGKKGNYAEDDVPDARELYGLSKLMGEATGDNCLTIRTSMIGRELETRHSILEWFLSRHEPKINGFVNAIYSGFPTVVLARIIADLIGNHPRLNGLYHISSDPISKFDLLNMIKNQYGSKVEIEPFTDYFIDRSLDSKKFRNETGFRPSPWKQMIEIMAADSTPYNEWH